MCKNLADIVSKIFKKKEEYKIDPPSSPRLRILIVPRPYKKITLLSTNNQLIPLLVSTYNLQVIN